MMDDKMMNEEQDVENVGIMQGFMDDMEDELEDEDELEGEEEDAAAMDRRPDSPEILMNNLRGDMRSIEARRDELADLVGYAAASETPEPVLAMLQPILAQGGGIGALPPSQAMAQGPQPPMAPPQGAAPGGMPPGAPPMVPGSEMAPPPDSGGIAALLAGAGGPPGAPPGGAPAGPPPMQMAAGGYVQRFQTGSDEDGVTPAGETSSLGFTPTPEMVQMARTQLTNMLAQKPLAVPDLAAESAKRAQMYKQIMGDNAESRQAQLLLSLGQRAFGFAGNVDDQGRPLRGSFVSRLAGATRTLPGEMAQYIAATDKEQRQLKLMGLQAAEKDIGATREQNLKLLDNQRKAFGDILKAAGKKADVQGGIFGKGVTGGALNFMYMRADDFAKGKLDPEEDRAFMTAITEYTQPTLVTYTNPLTQETGTREQRNQLPDFVATALRARNLAVPTATGGAPVTGGGRAAAPQPAAAAGGRARPVPAPGASVADLPADVAGVAQAAPQSTFFDLASTGTGFVPVLVAGVARNIPLEAAGRIKPEFQQATTMLENMRNRVVNVLQENPRFAEGERKQILSELNLGPRLLDNKQSFINQIIALDNVFSGIEDKTTALTQARETGMEKRREAFKKLEEVNFVRDLLGVRQRKIDNTDQWKAAAPGEYLVFDPNRKIYVYAQKKGTQ
jgi:hypothetical protein